MLQLRNICKTYGEEDLKTVALDNVNLTFKRNEIIAILGPSGCGKTTLLNIIGGLDTYDQTDFFYTGKSFLNFRQSDIILDGKSTLAFKEHDWDYYRNKRIGFVFQSYNLIPHLSVLDNVEMAMTLSGVDKQERRKRVLNILDQVKMTDHLHKKSANLSSGQRQRVAIARAIVNDPDIIIADEPTGALDSKSEREIMDLITKIAKDRLVIMATHNEDLAQDYATRLVHIKDGKVVSEQDKPMVSSANPYIVKPVYMSRAQSFRIALKNLRNKFYRAFIAILAGSIGIAGIATVLAISNGFSREISRFEVNTLAAMPISIHRFPMERTRLPLFDGSDFSYNFGPWFTPVETGTGSHTNVISYAYLDHLDAMNQNWVSTIDYHYDVAMPFLIEQNSGIIDSDAMNIDFQPLQNSEPYLMSQYTLQAGEYPTSIYDIVIIVDMLNHIDTAILDFLGVEYIDDRVRFDDVIGTEIVLVFNDDYDVVLDPESNELIRAFNQNSYDNGIKLTVTGVLKGERSGLETTTSGIFYLSPLEQLFITENEDSLFCTVLADVDDPSFDFINAGHLMQTRRSLGCTDIPTTINIYPNSLDVKTNIINHLNDYNRDLPEQDRILYTDLSATLSGILSSISINVTRILMVLGIVTLIISMLILGILIYVGLLERTKEIGVLRSLGARKIDVVRIFNLETMIIGLFAGVIGVILALLLTIPLNRALANVLVGFGNVVSLRLLHGIFLIIASVVLTFLAGFIPAHIAARKRPADAIRYNE